MKKVLLLVLAALMIPSVALATNPPQHPTHPPKVMYILRGALSGYHAYDSVTPANGSITILVKYANYHGRALKGQSLTFPVTANTRVSLGDGVTAIADGDRGIVKIRAYRRIPAADLAATLQASNARQIVDHGAPSS